MYDGPEFYSTLICYKKESLCPPYPPRYHEHMKIVTQCSYYTKWEIPFLYFVLYIISYAAVCAKIKHTNIFNNKIFTCVSYTRAGSVRN